MSVKAETRIRTRTEKLLLEAARRFNATLEYEELIEQVLKLVTSAVEAEAALVFRVDHSRSDMKMRFMKCPECKVQVFFQEFGSGVVGAVAEYKEPVLVNDPDEVSPVEKDIGRKAGVEIQNLISVPLIGKGQMIGVIEAFNKKDSPFSESDLDILVGLTNQIAVAIDNAHLYRAVRREALEKNLLYEVGMKLSSTLELDELLKEIMNTLKKIIEFSAGGIFLIDLEKNEIGSIYIVGYGERLQKEPNLKIGQGLIGSVAKSGEPVVVADVSLDPRYFEAHPGTKSEVVVPIKLNNKTIGVLNLESDHLGAFDLHAVSLLSAFATQAAISIERTRLHQKIVAGRKIDEQLNITREIQRSFLPDANPQIHGYDVAGTNIPSEQVGGDYYDFINIVEGQTGIVIGDVSGKGIPAALIMAAFRSSLLAEIRNNYSIATICRKVNSLVFESVRAGNFVSAVYGVLDSKNHVLTFSNCGHNLPLHFKANGQVDYLKEGGQVMGVSADVIYEQRPVVINAGEVIVFYTDGVTEVFDDAGREFGLERLMGVVIENQKRPSFEILDNIVKSVRHFASKDHLFDDLTAIVLKRTA